MGGGGQLSSRYALRASAVIKPSATRHFITYEKYMTCIALGWTLPPYKNKQLNENFRGIVTRESWYFQTRVSKWKTGGRTTRKTIIGNMLYVFNLTVTICSPCRWQDSVLPPVLVTCKLNLKMLTWLRIKWNFNQIKLIL